MGKGTVFLGCFLAGILAGTFVGNAQLPVGRWWSLPAFQEGNAERFFYVCRQRAGEGLAGWLLGMTVCAAPCFWILAGYMGFSLGWMISCYTAAFGVLGLPRFLLSCFPQGLCYVPAWYLLCWWGLKGIPKLRLRPVFFVLVLFILGAAAEAFLNPFFGKLL